MRADPHALVELGDAVGRDADTKRLWALLRDGHVIATGRLGVGKTTLARLIVAASPTGWRAGYVDLGAASTGNEALAAIRTGLRGSAGASAEPSAPSTDGVDLAAELATAGSADTEEGVALVLDDVDHWLTRLGPDERGPILAALAKLATHPRVRLALLSNTHLPRALERAGSAGMIDLFESCARVELDALAPEAGARLAMTLLLSERITTTNRSAFGRTLADRCDRVPAWIHCAVAQLAASKRGRKSADVTDADLDRCLAGAALIQPPWTLTQELAPVHDYAQPQLGLALAILDQLALAEDHALSFPELRRRLAMEATIDADAIERVLVDLRGDQLVLARGGRLQFAAELLCSGWAGLRGL